MEEHRINVEGTTNQRYPNILQSIIKDGCVLPPFNPQSYIYRAHERLRKVKPEAYEPMVVSIGPYHLQNSNLQAMKEHKKWYLHSLLKRVNERVETYILELEKLEDIVRKCYDEPILLSSEEFVEMMLLDGCFIIEFFRQKTVNPKLTVGWMIKRIFDDMMLLENQLPFFLLSKLYDMTKKKDDREEEPLVSLMVRFFKFRIPLPCVDDEHFEPPELKHLLHLVHALCHRLPRPRPTSLERNTKTKIKDFVLRPVHFLSKPLLMLIGSQNQDDIQSQIHSAVEFQEAGVKFKKVGEFHEVTANLSDVKFEDGLMELPCFSVEDSLDTFLRNLIAFEQYSEHIVSKYFTEYADFMSQLISSEKDVKLLRDEGIILNKYLRDDKEVSNLFYSLCDGVVFDSYLSNSYAFVGIKANRHYNKLWNRMRAAFVRTPNYFDTPFATASTIAAVVLLVLTLLQTIAVFIYK